MTASDRAQWIVVACTDCREHWLLENSERTVTAECPRCGRTHLRRKLQPLATAATDQEAADKRAELLMQTARSTGGATDEPVAMESFASARDRVEALSLAEQSAETARATGDAPTLDIPKVGHEEWNEAVWADLAAQGGLLEPTRAEQVQEALVEDGPFAFNTVATDIDEDTTLPDPDWPRDEGSLTPIFPGDDTALNDIELKIGPKMSQWGPTLVEKLLEPAADALRDRLRRDDELPSRRDVSAVATWLVRVAGVSAFDETWAHQFAEFALDRPDESQYDDMADAEEVRTRAAVEAQQRARRETLTQVAVPGGTPSGSVEQVVRGPIAALTILDDLLDISIRFDAAAWAAADTRTGQRSIDLLHALARTSTVKIVVSSRGLAEQLAAYDITADLTEPFEATPPTQAEATQSRSQQEKARDRLDAIDNWQNGYGRVLLALPDDRAMRQQELLETVVNLSSSGVSRALSTLERASLVRKESDANYNVVSLTSLGEVARAHIDSKDGSLRDPPPQSTFDVDFTGQHTRTKVSDCDEQWLRLTVYFTSMTK
ncbi:helix-turn-helix transcriptional regulator [Halosegnis longus]|uniref:helix-turn-helix transcriptional regulator n=1 Tax=Halosegnis longus TaxID=2216012 RepID=UPI00096A97E8|nr:MULTISPECIES: winged helix-turn-helix domain-containing protein [Halobacteriales]